MKFNRYLLLYCILLMLICGITVNALNNDITIIITSPEEEGIIYGDAIGSQIPIYVKITSLNIIKNVTISNRINQSACRKNKENDYVCNNPWHEGLNSVNVTAIDVAGNSHSITRNYSLVIGYLPPPSEEPTSAITQSPGFAGCVCITGLFIGVFLISLNRVRL